MLMNLHRMVVLTTMLLLMTAFGQRDSKPTVLPVPTTTSPPAADPNHGRYIDFANFARYANANEALGSPADGVNRVVFMGDSITDTWGEHFDAAFLGKPYVGRGISGQTTPQMVLRFEQDVVRLKPAVVVILAGINDIAENTGPETDAEIEDNFRAMTAMSEMAHIRVVIASILPAVHFPWRPALEPSARIRRLNTWLRDYAATSGLTYLDYYTAMVTTGGALNPDLAADKFVHPNTAGYAVMKPLAEAAISAALAKPAP